MWNKIKKYLHLIFIKYFGIIIIPLFVLDLVTKAVMEKVLGGVAGETIPLIPNLFDFQLVYNTGSFSGWLGGDVGHIVLILISLLGGVGLIYLLIKYRNKFNLGMNIGLALCIPGDLGNLVDRCFYTKDGPRGVIDFLHFYIPSLKFDWPVFNVADICLVAGVITFAVFYLVYDHKMEKEKKLAKEKAFEEAKKRLEEEKGDSDGK